MKTIELRLFGIYREYQPSSMLQLAIADNATVADLRSALRAHAEMNWPNCSRNLIVATAFASDSSIMRDADVIPDCDYMAALPPVSGG